MTSKGVLVELRVLGPLEIWHQDRQARLGSPKERCLLAILGTCAGEPVSAHTLVDRMWGDSQPKSAVPTLHAYLSRLRRNLRRLVGDEVQLDRPSCRTYRLSIAPDRVDLLRLRLLQRQARTAEAKGDAQLAVDVLREAEGLWRGEPFAEYTGDWFDMVRGRLHEDRWNIRQERIGLELRLGRHADLVGELREVVNEDPLAQHAVADLMLALYRCGRHSQALTEYQGIWRRLDELGLTPGPELQRLHQQILNQAPALDLPHVTLVPAGSPRPPAVSGSPASPRNNLPRDNGDFTGRDGELRRLLSPQDPHGTALPLTVVHGMAGVGKTTLTVHAAHLLRDDYPDGLFYVNLRAHSEQPPCDPYEALTLVLGATDKQPSEPAGARASEAEPSLDALAARWRDWTSHRRVLLVLDDAYNATQVRPLLPGSAICRVFITSRHRLANLDGAESVALEVMSRAEAASLFTHIVGSARTSDAIALYRVVELCGSLPLALQLSAHRFRHRDSWDLHVLVDRLTQASDVLEEIDGPSEIARAFQFSYDQLGAVEQQVFRRLALHPGPDIDLPAAMALVGVDESQAKRSLEELTDCYLLEEPVSNRYRFHDLLRGFARRVGRFEESETIRHDSVRRLLTYYLVAADHADRRAHSLRRRIDVPPGFREVLVTHYMEAGEAFAWLHVERGNLLAAAREAVSMSPEHAAFFPHVLAHSFKLWGVSQTTAELQETALTILRANGDRLTLAQSLVERAEALCHEDHEEALRRANESLSLFRELADARGQADALFQVGRAELSGGRRAASLRCLDDALVLYRKIDNRHGEAETLNVQGVALHYAGQLDEALDRFQKMLGISHSIGDLYNQATALLNMGEIYVIEKRYEQAQDYFKRSLVLARRIGVRQQLAHLYTNLGSVFRATDRTEQALSYFHKALEYSYSRDLRSEANTLLNIGFVYQKMGRHAEAMHHFTQAEGITSRIGNLYERQNALIGIATTQQQSGRCNEALATYREALQVAQEIEVPLGVARSLEGIAQTIERTGGEGPAKSYAERALAVYEMLGVLDDVVRMQRWLAER